MQDLTLVVMAAGMGSRFGGLKQITPVDLEGNFLIDYSIYDAIKAGFSKVVFIIKEENLEDFRNTIGKRLENKISVSYVFQRLEDVPEFVKIPETRVKPWGTVQALLAAKNEIQGPFAVINADDFYGFDSYKIVAQYLKNSLNENEHIAIPYPISRVCSAHGSVKRGVLFYHENQVLKILECNVEYQKDGSSRSMWKQYYKNPQGFAFLRKFYMQYNTSFKRNIMDAIHYVSSSKLAGNRHYIKESPKKLLTILMIPLGSIMKRVIIMRGNI